MATSYGFSPSSIKSAAEEAFVDARHKTEDFDDTESFNEEDCLFAEEGVDTDEDIYQGAFAHYSRKAAKSRSLQTSSQSAQIHQQRGVLTELNSQRIFSSYDERESFHRHIGAATVNGKASSRRARRMKKSSLSLRENLLAQAWERKRGLWQSEETENFNETSGSELLRRSCSGFGEESKKGSSHAESRNLRTRSLTDDDFEELRGCIDLNFRFDQNSIPDLCKTLPALEVYCAVAQSYHDSPISSSPVIQSPAMCQSPSGFPSWKVASPGDDPNVVKGKLRHWAQAVACHARLCC